ncbi:flavin-containing monooxygenase [Subtercola endophyticus]|uniref:flavin-containing monooxygenase n=1 Tax=Subtercola endophyticus TaxID=2895559 RepID=UPI001E3686E1|nr:NAD(P)/FAD-dependent oxidoreductase [Subtercola endophyticus]UFS58760.1 NAD(P)/FAD-dependent oxidoreductase [Subtercola endophyticus]
MQKGTRNDSVVDAVIVGAGFAGMYQLHKLRKLGLRSRIVEKAAGVGGTWYWNRYPGCRCDIPSLFYTVSYTPEINDEWSWPERFGTHAAIREYMEEIARREDMLKDISFSTVLTGATWNDETSRWTSVTDSGEEIESRYLILATGALSESRVPAIPGLDGFEGRWFHTGRWPHEEIDFTGRRVALIGTGSTGVQTLPVVAEQAAEVLVIQRMPKFVLPAVNVAVSEEEARPVKDAYPVLRAMARRGDYGTPFPVPTTNLLDYHGDELQAYLEERWNAGDIGGFVTYFADHLGLKVQEVNDIVADFCRGKIREIVEDPATAEALVPYGYPIGINRIIVGTNYYETYNRDNVTLHSVVNDPIVEITAHSIKTENAEFEVDDIIFATGYDGLTGSFTSIDARGRSGVSIKENWADGPKTYLGMQMSDFPNLFLITAPGGPSVLSNVITTTEQSIDFICGLIEHAESVHADTIEVDAHSEAEWMDHVADVAQESLYRFAANANSWYTGSNVPGKKIVFMPYAGGVGRFESVLEEVAADDYRGFHLEGAEVSA